MWASGNVWTYFWRTLGRGPQMNPIIVKSSRRQISGFLGHFFCNKHLFSTCNIMSKWLVWFVVKHMYRRCPLKQRFMSNSKFLYRCWIIKQFLYSICQCRRIESMTNQTLRSLCLLVRLWESLIIYKLLMTTGSDPLTVIMFREMRLNGLL